MRFFSIRIVCACILLPPVLYLLTVQILVRRVEIVAIGTKNTQERELEFLASL